MKCSIITIGTELLIGQVIDTNSAYLGENLNNVGIEIVSKISISDTREDILKALYRAEEDADLILITGGLGPTKDDITKTVLAEHLGVSLYFDESQYKRILAFFEKINYPTTPAHKQQCYFPETVQFIDNNMGTAQGMLFTTNGKRIISMPGVPYEMKYIMEHGVLPMLKAEQKRVILHKTIQTAGIGETRLADLVSDLEDELPDNIEFAYLPGLGKVRFRISVSGVDSVKVEEELQTYQDKTSERFGKYVVGYDDDSLSSRVGQLLKEKNMMLGLAESCTGGSVASMITSVAGSSAYFEGGIVSYTNKMKKEILGVKKETLLAHGAVSEEVVREMVEGTVQLLGVDVAISISGIAGPSGGTPDKPVGTVWLCVGNKEKQETKKLNLLKDRSKNIEYSSYAALNLLRLFLEEK